MIDLCTKLAFPDNEESLGTMKKCRELAGFFAMSCQSAETLRLKQGPKPLDVIQDVVTRWWSTYAMLERLIHLRPYFDCMVREGLLYPAMNLTTEQWIIVEDVCAILAPFRFIQQKMEGEKYVTISLIPGLINEIRQGLLKVEENESTSNAAMRVVNVITAKFNDEFGTGAAGTVFSDHTIGGPSRRLKGFQLKTMVAAALDPRTKNLAGT